ncbi:MAG: sugar ABC transporter permease [Microbacteriaceae bacterium]
MSSTKTKSRGSVRTETLNTVALDLQDERLIAATGIGGAVRAFGRRVRGGELGSLPVVVGLVVIWAVFGILDPTFFSPFNLVNLTLQSAATGTIAVGIVLVLLLGEIDLSVGSVSGLSAAIIGTLFVGAGWSIWLTILVALAAGAAIGLLYGLLFTRFGVPAFVVTLAGLLAFLGVQLLVLGPDGSINIPFKSGIVQFASQTFLPDWASYALVVIAAAVYALSLARRSQSRRRAGLSGMNAGGIALRAGALLVLTGAVAVYLNQGRGIGAIFLVFIAVVVIANYALTRTRWGRYLYAIGGNVEAARRAGIRVRSVYVSVFVLCSTLAALGGILAAARLGAASQQSGSGDTNLNAIAAAVIGGTSLFGGRGSAYSALLGIIVITSISNGLNLLSLDSSVRYMITGAVLVLAVIVDSLSRRSRAASGRG